MQWLVPTKNGPRKDNQWIDNRVTGSHWFANEGYTVWYNATEELLQHKKLMLSTIDMYQDTQRLLRLLCSQMCSCRLVRVHIMTLKHLSIRTGPWSNGRKDWSDELPFLLNHVHHVTCSIMGRREANGGSVLRSVLLGNLGSWHSGGYYMYYIYKMYHTSIFHLIQFRDSAYPRRKAGKRQGTPLNGNDIT